DARMVGIVAAVRGEVEGDGEALLPVREIAAIERVRILGRGEARVLSDGPGLLHVHRGVGPAPERRKARKAVDEVEALAIGRGVGVLHRDAFRRQPGIAAVWRGRPCDVDVERELGEIGQAHGQVPSAVCSVSSSSTTSWPAWMNWSTPASRSLASPSPGLPARTIQSAPAALSRCAAFSAASA